MGTWDDAERFRQEHQHEDGACPFCRGDARMIEQVNQEWVCYSCSKAWPVVTLNDKRLLKQLKIDPS